MLILNKLGKAHNHLNLEPVLWENDLPHSNYPGYKNVQDAINESELKDCPLVLFIFYSKIGKHTLEEFEYATANNKRIFTYFRIGFESDLDTAEGYGKLIKFKKALDERLLSEQYIDLNDFEKKLYINLNLYISKYYPKATDAELVKRLIETEHEITVLKQKYEIETQELKELWYEKEAMIRQLQQSQQIIQQQAKDKTELEKQLNSQKENNILKSRALAEVEKRNYNEAEKYLKQSAKDSTEETASTFFQLGKIKKIQLQFEEAYNYFDLAAKIEPQNSSYLMESGDVANILGYYDKAIAYYENLLIIQLQIPGEDHSITATTYINLGLAYSNKGEYDKAINNYERALVVDKKFYDKEHPNIAIDYNNLSLAYKYKGEYDKAIEYCEKALVIDKKFYGEESPNIAISYNNLGSAYISKSNYDKAIDCYDKALSVERKFYGDEHLNIAVRYNYLGLAYINKGEYDIAINFYEKALVIDKKFYNEEHPGIARDYSNLGVAHQCKGEYNIAIKYYERCLSIIHKFLPPNHPHILTTEGNLRLARNATENINF